MTPYQRTEDLDGKTYHIIGHFAENVLKIYGPDLNYNGTLDEFTEFEGDVRDFIRDKITQRDAS